MKSFIYQINEDGSADFMDSKDKAVYERLLSSIKKSGRDKFKVTVELLEEKKTTDSQNNLLRVLYSMIADESGNDYWEVRSTLIENLIPGKDEVMLNHQQFQDYIEKIIVFCNEFFNLNVDFDSETNHINISKIR